MGPDLLPPLATRCARLSANSGPDRVPYSRQDIHRPTRHALSLDRTGACSQSESTGRSVRPMAQTTQDARNQACPFCFPRSSQFIQS